jgi:dTDP-4-amino-4,6-dideoxygalactose transaminase
MPAASRTILLASVACTYGINLPIGVAGGTSIPTLSPPAKFMGDFSKPMAIPEAGIAKAIEVMQSGRLFRYIATDSQVAKAEVEFAELAGAKYALGVNSCSSAILISMMLAGVQEGDEVITNGLTFTALPSTIMRLGATPVLVEATEGWTMDLEDLEKKAASSNAKVLLLSHMRGKVCDMDRVVAICEKYGLTLLEDCAHGCGVQWKGRQLGYHGKVTAWSTQSDKVINSGEGGFVTTNDPELIARAIYLSGAYERRYAKHASRPDDDELLESKMMTTPNLSMRMMELTAACVRPLIANLPARVVEYNRRYAMLVTEMKSIAGGIIKVPEHLPDVSGVGDHLNFRLEGVTDEENRRFRETCAELGVVLGWFSSEVNARWHQNWRKYGTPSYDLPNTDELLKTAYDMKVPPHFSDDEVLHVARVIGYAAATAVAPPDEDEMGV